MQRSTILALLAAVATLAAGGAEAARAPAFKPLPRPGTNPPPRTSGEPDAARGFIVYTANGCWQCHGTDGASGGPGGRLAPNPLPYEAVHKQLRQPRARMPVYTEAVLSENDIQDLYAYLKKTPPAKTLAEIPLLNDLYK